MADDPEQFLRDSVEGLVRKSPLGIYTDTMSRLGDHLEDALTEGKRQWNRLWPRPTDPRQQVRGDIELPDARKTARRPARRSGR